MTCKLENVIINSRNLVINSVGFNFSSCIKKVFDIILKKKVEQKTYKKFVKPVALWNSIERTWYEYINGTRSLSSLFYWCHLLTGPRCACLFWWVSPRGCWRSSAAKVRTDSCPTFVSTLWQLFQTKNSNSDVDGPRNPKQSNCFVFTFTLHQTAHEAIYFASVRREHLRELVFDFEFQSSPFLSAGSSNNVEELLEWQSPAFHLFFLPSHWHRQRILITLALM